MAELTILAVDRHNKFFHSARKYLLTLPGVQQVLLADNVQEALNLGKAEQPDLVLVSGVLLQEEKASTAFLEILSAGGKPPPVYVLTLFSDGLDLNELPGIGTISGFIQKEFFADQVRTIIREMTPQLEAINSDNDTLEDSGIPSETVQYGAGENATEPYLVFSLSSQDYAFPVREVREVMSMTKITAMPRAPVYVTGVINLRGTILPIIDTCHRLGLLASINRQKQKILVISGPPLFGLIVDEVKAVTIISQDQISKTPVSWSGAKPPLYLGICRCEQGLMVLIDPYRLVGSSLWTDAQNRSR